MSQMTLNGPNGLRLVLDKNKVIKDDPGADTPAMVYLDGFCATYWCACGEGELLSDKGCKILSKPQMAWLERQDEKLTEFLYR